MPPLDLYAGPITIYEERDWKDPSPSVPPINPDKPYVITFVDRTVSRPKRRAEIAIWRENLSSLLGARIEQPLDWDETSQTYCAASPGHDGLRLLKQWAGDARSSAAALTQGFNQLLQPVEFWLPASFDFTFQEADPSGTVKTFGSGITLLRQLQELNAATWNASQSTIQDWSERTRSPSQTEEELVQFAFAETFLAAQYACEYRQPLILDQ